MMKAGLERRLVRLEKASSCRWAGLQEETQKRALQAISDGDLQLLQDWSCAGGRSRNPRPSSRLP